MISSLDTYVYKTFERILPEILKDENLIKQTLINIDDEARERFIEMFCGEDPKEEITLSYSFPEAKQKFIATLVIQSGKSVKANSSIGGVESTFTDEEYGVEREKTVVEQYDKDPSLLSIPLSNAIGEVLGIDKLSFSMGDDDPHIDNNKILFNKQGNESLINKDTPLELIVTYVKIDSEKDVIGSKIGYTSRETVEVTPFSNNMDVARSLDIIIHTLLIIMQQGIGEQTNYLLQDFSIGEMQMLGHENDPTQTFYGRAIEIKYTVSNSINYYYNNALKEIILENRI